MQWWNPFYCLIRCSAMYLESFCFEGFLLVFLAPHMLWKFVYMLTRWDCFLNGMAKYGMTLNVDRGKLICIPLKQWKCNWKNVLFNPFLFYIQKKWMIQYLTLISLTNWINISKNLHQNARFEIVIEINRFFNGLLICHIWMIWKTITY